VPVCLATPACACARPCCRRRRLYPSDTTDAEWALIAPLLPVPACQTAAGGRPEEHSRRVVVDAIRYVIHNGCVWRALPADFPPWPTLRSLFPPGGAPLDGVIEQVADGLLQQVGVPRTMPPGVLCSGCDHLVGQSACDRPEQRLSAARPGSPTVTGT